MSATIARRAGRFDRHRPLLLAGVTLTLACATDVLGTSLLEKVRNDLSPHTQIEKSYRIRASRYHHDLRPNVSNVSAVWGPLRYPLKTNSLGFKDAAPRQVPLRAPARRVLFIGDSFTEGVGYPYERTWVGLVATGLAGQGIEVLNAGVSSYSLSIYLKKVEYLVEDVELRFDELVGYLDISDVQDEALGYRIDTRGRVVEQPRRGQVPRFTRRYYQRTHPLERFVDHHTTVARFVTFDLLGDRLRSPEARLSRVVDYTRSAWTYEPSAFDAFGRVGLDRMTARMNELAELLKARGIGLTVGVYPWPGQVIYDVPESMQARHWREWSARHEARFVNHFPDFVVAGSRVKNVQRYFVSGDSHWNEAGHRRIADRFLAEWETAQRRASHRSSGAR